MTRRHAHEPGALARAGARMVGLRTAGRERAMEASPPPGNTARTRRGEGGVRRERRGCRVRAVCSNPPPPQQWRVHPHYLAFHRVLGLLRLGTRLGCARTWRHGVRPSRAPRAPARSHRLNGYPEAACQDRPRARSGGVARPAGLWRQAWRGWHAGDASAPVSSGAGSSSRLLRPPRPSTAASRARSVPQDWLEWGGEVRVSDVKQRRRHIAREAHIASCARGVWTEADVDSRGLV